MTLDWSAFGALPPMVEGWQKWEPFESEYFLNYGGFSEILASSLFSLQQVYLPSGLPSSCSWEVLTKKLWHWTHISTTLDQAKRVRNHWKNLDLIGLSQKGRIPSKSTTSRYSELHLLNADEFSWNKVEICIYQLKWREMDPKWQLHPLILCRLMDWWNWSSGGLHTSNVNK